MKSDSKKYSQRLKMQIMLKKREEMELSYVQSKFNNLQQQKQNIIKFLNRSTSSNLANLVDNSNIMANISAQTQHLEQLMLEKKRDFLQANKKVEITREHYKLSQHKEREINQQKENQENLMHRLNRIKVSFA